MVDTGGQGYAGRQRKRKTNEEEDEQWQTRSWSLDGDLAAAKKCLTPIVLDLEIAGSKQNIIHATIVKALPLGYNRSPPLRSERTLLTICLGLTSSVSLYKVYLFFDKIPQSKCICSNFL